MSTPFNPFQTLHVFDSRLRHKRDGLRCLREDAWGRGFASDRP